MTRPSGSTYDVIIRGGEVANHAGRGMADIGVRDGRIVEELKEVA